MEEDRPDKDDAASWIDKGNVLDDQRRYQEALQAYDQAIEIDPE